MIPDKDFIQLYKTTSMSHYGPFGLEIRIAGVDKAFLDRHDNMFSVVHDCVEKIEHEVRSLVIAEDPKHIENARLEKEQLLRCFPSKIFVEAIPNGYSTGWYSKHLPWFVVTTEVGRFTIGWRKRVINIDWSATVGTKKSDELFPEVTSTKGDKYIHAYLYEDAKKYIETIINTATKQ